MADERDRITVTLDPELVDELDQEAEETDRSRSRVIEDRLKESVRRGASGEIRHTLTELKRENQELKERVDELNERVSTTFTGRVRDKLNL